MFGISLRLISILGLLTALVMVGLVIDYLHMWRRPWRVGLIVAILGIAAGVALTVSAVLPAGNFYGPVFTEVRTKHKIVALTFDDGPYPPYTGQILDILREYNVPATFFVVGRNTIKHPELVRRIVEEGHQVGNHTYSHIDLLKADRNGIITEIEQADRAIALAAGVHPHIVRPPHGFRDAVVMQICREKGLKVVEWSVLSRDWTNPGVQTIVQRTLSKVTTGSVILLHDGDGISQTASRAQTVEATRHIIRELLAQGYQFVTVDEIIKRNGES